MSNSSLVTYTRISPNKNSPRNHKIDTVTIHCIVGQWTAKQGCDYFSNPDVESSPNYVVGYDGSVGLCVDEGDRSWCSSNSTNDNRAITIEVASETEHPYEVTDAALKTLINLLADICKRNGIKKLLWKGDKSLIGRVDKQNMTVHRWFDNKACPGDYLYSKHSYIANEVNKKLGVKAETTTKPAAKPATKTETTTALKAGTKFSLKEAELYVSSDAKSDVGTVSGTYYAWDDEIINKRIRITNSKNNVGKVGQVTGWIDYADAKTPAKTTTTTKPAANATTKTETFTAYKTKVTVDALNIRKGPGTNYGTNGMIRDRGVYTIVAESKGAGSIKGWGKLKSGAGWISLDYVKRI